MTDADQQSIENWLIELKASYPHLPDHLSIEVEKSRLAVLKSWFRRVQRLRILYDQMDHSSLPDRMRKAGKRQVVPVLMSLENMTDEEVTAWHELFVPLSAMMTKIAYKYYKAHVKGRSETSLTLIDVLNYLPVVFLYVLSSYDPTRGSQHEGSAEKGRVRLSTWIWRDARRHINSYMQQHAYTVKRGVGAVHRLKSDLRDAQRQLYADLGRDPSREEVLAYVSEEKGEEIDVEPELYNKILNDDTLSLHTPATDDGSATYEDMLTERTEQSEDEYDPVQLAMKLARGNQKVEEALRKLFNTDEKLTTKERFHLGV